MVDEFSDMSLADSVIEQADYDSLPLVGPLVAFNFLWRWDHPSLPAPRYKFVQWPSDDRPAECPPGDGACRMVRGGSTEWVREIRLSARWIG